MADGATADPALLRDALDRAVEQTLRAGQIIRRLREFVARGETERQMVSIAKLIEEASTLALVGVRQGDVVTTLALGGIDLLVVVDRIQIQQVILNLIRNAIEAMQDVEHRHLIISAQGIGNEMVEVTVTDTGPGLAPEIAGRLFQPFTTTKTYGMGVGLSISRTIVEAHGGKLWAEANPQGGTIFRMTLRTAPREQVTDGA